MRQTDRNLCKRFCLVVATFLFVASAWAQQKVITGTVTDDAGQPLPGVAVVVEGTSVGTVTNFDGYYSISVESKVKSLSFSFVGMKTVSVQINNQSKIDVKLETVTVGVEEVVVVAYGTQKKVTVTGSVSSVDTDQLSASPNASVSNALAGKVTGLSSIQYSGQPGADAADLYVRGVSTLSAGNSSPLMMVDGVERSFSQLDPDEIADITILKDASATAVYGIRGANGVILVTTKRGTKGAPKISVSTSYGIQKPTKLPKFADSYTYATVYNNAQRGDGLSEEALNFPAYVVEAFRTNSDPILFPNIDWMDYMVRPTSPQSKTNFSISGGTNRLKYFASFGYINQVGLLKEFDTGTGENYTYNRYNYRTNVDVDVTKTTQLSFSLGGQSQVRNEPAMGDINQMWRFLYRYAIPYASPGVVDGKYIVDNGEYVGMGAGDPLSQYYGGGSDNRVTNVMNFDLVFNQDLNALTKGLKFRIKAAYNVNSTQEKIRATSPNVYTMYYLRDFDDTLPESDKTLVFPQISRGGNVGYSESYGKERDWYMETALTYDRRFGDHEVGGLLLYNQRNTYYPDGSYSYLPRGYVGTAARLTYNYRTKYLAEINVGYNGSENFHRDNRYGLFPALSLGWILSEEAFMKTNMRFINYLKIRGSYGLVGSDNQGNSRFLYLPDSYTSGDGYNFGVNIPSKQPGYYESKLGNHDVTWETAVKQNYGLDLKVLNNKLTLNADYFIEDRKDILTTRNTVPGIVAATLPAVNIGEVHNQGYELSIKWNDKIGDFQYWVDMNMSHTRNKIVYMDEVPQRYDYLLRTGGLVGQPFGMVTLGFYNESDFDADGNLLADLPIPTASVKPGDAKYLDTNGDMFVNAEDMKAVGYPEYPLYNYGFNMGFKVKNFDFTMSWVAATHTSRVLGEIMKDPYGDTSNQSLLQYMVDQSWTPETAATATMPRITFTNRLYNRFTAADMWVKDASYLRLKNLEIGYNIKGQFLKTIGANNVRLYLNGYNLLTFDKLVGYGDPEAKMDGRPTYPAMRVFNVGVKVNF